jgi:hypothetical protein
VAKLDRLVKQLGDQMGPLQALGEQVDAVEQQLVAMSDQKIVNQLQAHLAAIDGQLETIQAASRGL